MSPDTPLEPQSPFKSSHALTDIDDVKAATTARRNEKRIARARLGIWDVSIGTVALVLPVTISIRRTCFYNLVESVFGKYSALVSK